MKLKRKHTLRSLVPCKKEKSAIKLNLTTYESNRLDSMLSLSSIQFKLIAYYRQDQRTTGLISMI
jgi:hypothetical protein